MAAGRSTAAGAVRTFWGPLSGLAPIDEDLLQDLIYSL